MPTLSADRLAQYQRETFRLEPDQRITTPEAAIPFIAGRGFVYFWPIKGAHLPSLWAAVRGDRPVADEHDDPGHVTWGWKDSHLGGDSWYYAKVLRGKATFIGFDTLPYFYALSENFGDPETDYLQTYQDGMMTREARVVYETLLRLGALDTIRLRREANLAGKNSKSPFDRALVALQRDFKILPVGVSEAGGWNYSHIYDCLHRVYPNVLDQARSIGRKEARAHLLMCYFESLGAASEKDARFLFQWRLPDLRRTLAALVDDGRLVPGTVENSDDEQYILPALL